MKKNNKINKQPMAEDFLKNMGGMFGGVPQGPKIKKGIIRSYNFHDFNPNLNRAFFISCKISIREISGMRVKAIAEKLGLTERIFLPPVDMACLVKIPIFLAEKLDTPKIFEGPHLAAEYYLHGDFKNKGVAVVLNEAHKFTADEAANIIKQGNDEEQVKRIVLDWTDLEKNDIIISADYENQASSGLPRKIFVGILRNVCSKPDELYTLLEKYTKETTDLEYDEKDSTGEKLLKRELEIEAEIKDLFANESTRI